MLMTQKEIEGLMAQVNKAFDADRNRIAETEFKINNLMAKIETLEASVLKAPTTKVTKSTTK